MSREMISEEGQDKDFCFPIQIYVGISVCHNNPISIVVEAAVEYIFNISEFLWRTSIFQLTTDEY